MARMLVLAGLAALVACSGTSTSGNGATAGGRTAAGGNSGFPSTAPSTSKASAGLAGNYTVTGTNSDGSAYRGRATITGTGPSYHVSWLIGSGASSGDGVLSGATLVVRFSGAVTGKGTVTYQLHGDGRLVGTWRVDGSSGQGTETLTPA